MLTQLDSLAVYLSGVANKNPWYVLKKVLWLNHVYYNNPHLSFCQTPLIEYILKLQYAHLSAEGYNHDIISSTNQISTVSLFLVFFLT